MAVPTPKKFVQELPPAGGFPSVTYRKFPLQRGPAGVWIVVGTTLLTGFGIYQACLDNQERNYEGLARFNQRYERAFVLQAREDVRWERKQKLLLDRERELMKDYPGWVVGKNVYHTMPMPRPDVNHTDPRRITHW